MLFEGIGRKAAYCLILTILMLGASSVAWVPADAGGEIIIIDPGHGGSDSGAIGPTGLQEKDVNLNIGLKVWQILKDEGYDARLTRDKDVDVSLEDRVKIANDANAEKFISIHCNSGPPGAKGTETFYCKENPFPDASKNLANSIQSKVVADLGTINRGVKDDFEWLGYHLYVLKNTKMRAALIEVAFITNAEEEAMLKDPAKITKAAQAISDGIKAAQVGGIVIPVDKFGLLAPYIGLASTTMIALTATIVYVKRFKHKKRNNKHALTHNSPIFFVKIKKGSKE